MNNRLILGFSVAPLAPCLLAATIASVSQGQIVAIPFVTLGYAIVTYPFAFILGIPGYLLMSRLGLLSMPYVTFSGLFLGAVSGILMPLTLGAEWQRVFVPDRAMAMAVVTCGSFGLLTGWVFWWLALRPRSNIAFERARARMVRPLTLGIKVYIWHILRKDCRY